MAAPGGGWNCPGAAGFGVGNGGATPRLVCGDEVAQPLISSVSRITILAQCAICCSLPALSYAVKRNSGIGAENVVKMAKLS